VQPFFGNAPESHSEDEGRYVALLAERERAIQALQELEFDYELGKIPPEDYPALRKQLLARGAEVLRKLDAYEEQRPASSDDDLEAMIAARREQIRAEKR
jgi:hypothetical protein